MNKKCYYPQAEGPLLFGRSQLRIKNIRSYAPYLEAPHLLQQIEDAPCRGDRDPYT